VPGSDQLHVVCPLLQRGLQDLLELLLLLQQLLQQPAATGTPVVISWPSRKLLVCVVFLCHRGRIKAVKDKRLPSAGTQSSRLWFWHFNSTTHKLHTCYPRLDSLWLPNTAALCYHPECTCVHQLRVQRALNVKFREKLFLPRAQLSRGRGHARRRHRETSFETAATRKLKRKMRRRQTQNNKQWKCILFPFFFLCKKGPKFLREASRQRKKRSEEVPGPERDRKTMQRATVGQRSAGLFCQWGGWRFNPRPSRCVHEQDTQP